LNTWQSVCKYLKIFVYMDFDEHLWTYLNFVYANVLYAFINIWTCMYDYIYIYILYIYIYSFLLNICICVCKVKTRIYVYIHTRTYTDNAQRTHLDRHGASVWLLRNVPAEAYSVEQEEKSWLKSNKELSGDPHLW